MILSPNDIDVLLHCHCCPGPHPRLFAPAVSETVRRFLAEGLIAPSEPPADGCYTTTERGAAHVHQLCALELPRQAWVNKDGEPIRRA